MNYLKKIFSIIISPLFFINLISCEKEIDLEINPSDIKWVVEAKVSDQTNQSKIRISKSVFINSTQAYPIITNANVNIKDLTTNITYPMLIGSNGNYENINLIGIENHLYQLDIQVDGQSFTAQSKMPKKVTFNALSQAEAVITQTNENISNTELLPEFNDPSNDQNQYNFVIKKNQELIKKTFIYEDLYFNGLANTRKLRFNAKKDDVISVEMQCIDKPVYDYYFGIMQNANANSATPANPLSNILGGAIGYFSAYTSSEKNLVLY